MIHLELIFTKNGVSISKDAFLAKDEMFNTYRYILIWDPIGTQESHKRAYEDVILRTQYPTFKSAIEGLKDFEFLTNVREITDYNFYSVKDFIKYYSGEEENIK